MFRSRLLLAAAVPAMALANLPAAPTSAQDTLSCGQRCRLDVALEPAGSREGGLSQWVRLTVTNTMSGGGMPGPILINPWDLRVVATSPSVSPIESRLPHRQQGTTYTALPNAPVAIAPYMSQSFWIEIRRLPPGANRIEILRGETALGGIAVDFSTALAILNPPPAPPPPSTTLPDPARDPGFSVSPSIAAAFRGSWWTGDGTFVFGDRPDEGLAGAYYDATGRHAGRFEIARALSTPEHLDVGLVRDGQRQVQDMILTPDGGASLIVTEKGGNRAGTVIYRARRVGGLGSRDVTLSVEQLLERLGGRWQTPFGDLTLDSQDGHRGHIAATGGEPAVWFDVAPTQDRLGGHAVLMTWRDGETINPRNQIYLTVSADGSRLLASHPDVSLRGRFDWEATRIVQPSEPTPPADPVPPVVAPAPPTPGPITPAPEPVPPSRPELEPPEPEAPAPQPLPPVEDPTPPVVQPTPPQPSPPRPTPPVPTPPQPAPPATGGTAIGGSGGFQGISQTWDVQFEGARVERGSEIHVFVSVKNRSTSDQYITPGTFIPNLSNQDGEVITNRAVYRASGDNPTEFRPTVPVNEAVRVRFIFRPEAGTAQPRSFTLESFGHRKLTFDVSGLRVDALAQ